MLFKSMTFWTLFVGVAFFIIRWYVPTFPLEEGQILSLVLFFLGLIGIYPTIKSARIGLLALVTPPVLNSLAFLQLLAGLVAFVIQTVAPDAPLTKELILGAFLFILGLFQIHPELRARNIL